MINVEVRGVKIGEGIPKITVPIVGKNDVEIIEEVQNLENAKYDLVEWRVDFYENVSDVNSVMDILIKIRTMIPKVPIIFTFRSKKEGGEKSIDFDDYIDLNIKVIESKLIDLVDVELFMGDKVVKKILNYAHKNDVKVIISNHDFEKTPSKDEIVRRLVNMIKIGGDIPKIAVMPQNQDDVLTLLSATNKIKEKYKDRPIITMSMGQLGLISRLCGQLFGSDLTFGSAGKVSAPGQIDTRDLDLVLNLLKL